MKFPPTSMLAFLHLAMLLFPAAGVSAEELPDGLQQ